MRREAKHYYMYVVSDSANTRAAFDGTSVRTKFLLPLPSTVSLMCIVVYSCTCTCMSTVATCTCVSTVTTCTCIHVRIYTGYLHCVRV